MNLFVTDWDTREVKIFDVLSSSSHHPAVRNGQWLWLENRHACGKARLVVDGNAQRPLSLWTWLIVAESVLCDRMTLESRVRKREARHRVVGVAVVIIFIVGGDTVSIVAFQNIGLALLQQAILIILSIESISEGKSV